MAIGWRGKMLDKSLKSSDDWSDSWVQHIEKYLAAPPRCGIWLYSYFSRKTLSFLECAGGSCRDSRFLFEKKLQSVGSDFDEKTLNYLFRRFSDIKFPLSKEDAFALSFDDDTFDVVFHNGFWIYFDDVKILSLLKEQARVSKRYAVVLVHNARNQALVDRFKEMSVKDVLYKARFFDIDALEEILKLSGLKHRGVKYEKFGGPFDILFAFERKIPFLSPLVRWLVPRLYRYQPWDKVERIAMIIELDK